MEYFYKIKSYISNFFKCDTIVVPEQGDVVEMEDGSRKIVLFSEEPYIFVPEYLEKVPNRRGRSRQVVCVEKVEWPIAGAYLYRGNNLIFPQKNYKLSVLVWLNNLLLRK